MLTESEIPLNDRGGRTASGSAVGRNGQSELRPKLTGHINDDACGGAALRPDASNVSFASGAVAEGRIGGRECFGEPVEVLHEPGDVLHGVLDT